MPFLERLREGRWPLQSLLRGSRVRRSTTKSDPPPDHQSSGALDKTSLIECVPANGPPTNCEDLATNCGGLPRSCESPPTPLWDRAYDALGKSDPQLVEKYEKLLSDELQMIGVYLLQATISCRCFPPWSIATANFSSTQVVQRAWLMV